MISWTWLIVTFLVSFIMGGLFIVGIDQISQYEQKRMDEAYKRGYAEAKPYTNEEIQRMSDLEQAYDLGRESMRQTGKWIPFHSRTAGDIQYCSRCHIGCPELTAYCPHCGAKMGGDNDETD